MLMESVYLIYGFTYTVLVQVYINSNTILYYILYIKLYISYNNVLERSVHEPRDIKLFKLNFRLK